MIRETIRRVLPLAVRKPYVEWKTRKAEASGLLFCPACQANVRRFLPHGNPARADEVCPICQSKSCHRLSWAYFAQHPALFINDGVFLHIAPERQLRKWLKNRCRLSGMHYRHGDIKDMHHPLDIKQTGLTARSVDVLFACHVLNMVDNDRLAMAEIKRIVKPGGVAVIPVPVSEVFSEVSPGSAVGDRLARFNDGLMFRAYTTREYAHRLKEAGMSLQEFNSFDVQDASKPRWMLLDDTVHIARPLQ